MSDLLIAVALDFTGVWPSRDRTDRIARTMVLGRAGDVRWDEAGGAAMFARAERSVRVPRIRRAQMVAAADGGVTMLAGRLFERAAARAALGLSRECDDPEIYAAAHMRWGDACDQRLVGNYAAIRWFPDSRRLRIARSPTSDCPIHMWRDGTRLVAASIPRVLFAAGAPDSIADQALAEMALGTGPSGASSIYSACSRVPAATIAEIDRAGERMRQYWSIAEAPAVRFKRDAEYVEAVDFEFRRSLRAHLADIRQPAVSLSGGLDSQAVAAFAVAELPPGAKLRTFTAVPMPGWTPPPRPWKFGDEAAHVRALAAMYPQIEPVFLDASGVRFGEHLQARSLLSGWPPGAEANAHWGDACAAAAATAGCDALLGGDMGNVGFSYDGLTGFPEWFRRGRWRRLARELSASDDPRPMWRKFASLAVWPHVPRSLKQRRDRDNPWHFSPFETWAPLREDYARASGALARARKVADLDGYAHANSRRWRDEVWQNGMRSGPEIMLGFQLLHGIAQPDPTAFVPLLELCAGIPDEQFLRDGTDRWLARRLLAGKVPDMVRTERREGLQAADWPLRFARERESLLEEISRLQADPRLAKVFDFGRMARDLAQWDGTDTVAERHLDRINACVGQGIALARFVRFVEGRNVG